VFASRRHVSAESVDECLGVEIESVDFVEPRAQLDLDRGRGVSRGQRIPTSAGFDLAEVLVGLGGESVKPSLGEVIEHGLERRPGRLELTRP
jgi:hypothetical protein